MEDSIVHSFVALDREKFPNGPPKIFSYGTAGFRDKANLLDCVMFRAGMIASLRSKCARGAIGVIITASHNPEEDNGVKFVDTQGQMLIPDWEQVATDIANSKPDELQGHIVNVISRYNLQHNNFTPVVHIARDTRPSSDHLLSLVIEGLTLLGTQYYDNGILTTPQLHYIVKAYNTEEERYGVPTVNGYYEKLSVAFKALMPSDQGGVKPVMKLDGANGVGAGRVRDLMTYINDVMNIEVYNDGSNGKLNYMCGADYVKTQQLVPNGIPVCPGDSCVSFDGDGDRIVFFYSRKNGGQFVLLDGDRIASLMAMYIKDLLAKLKLDITTSVVQTAYANGSSTKYLQDTLNVQVVCVKTGVKYLQRKAQEFDIGIFFEANGHGTILYSEHTVQRIRKIIQDENVTEERKKSGEALLHLIDLTNQTTGDAISDLLIVQVILSHKQWSFEEWSQLYDDLPNELLKVQVKDRTVITTTDAERVCLTPPGLQDEINKLVSEVSLGRSFVRPSGTEDVVRIYAEAQDKEMTHSLAVSVAQKVYDMAGGIGDRL